MVQSKKLTKKAEKTLRRRATAIDDSVNGCDITPSHNPLKERQAAREIAMSGKIVERDMERFKLLFTNCLPKMPDGFKAPLRVVATREQIAERLASQKAK